MRLVQPIHTHPSFSPFVFPPFFFLFSKKILLHEEGARIEFYLNFDMKKRFVNAFEFILHFLIFPLLFSFFEKEKNSSTRRNRIWFEFRFEKRLVNAFSIIHTHLLLSRRLLLLSPSFFPFFEKNTLPRGVESNFSLVKFRFEKKDPLMRFFQSIHAYPSSFPPSFFEKKKNTPPRGGNV